MIKSMTGYGKANLEKNARKYQVEIKTVNHRYLDISIKLPRILSYLEENIKQEISSKIKRGKVDVFVTFENNSLEGKEIRINTELATAYISELKKLAEQEQILSSDIQVTEIAKYPDVLKIQENTEDETIKNEMLQATKEALENLVMMRQQEGRKIVEDLKGRLETIKEKIRKSFQTFYWTY